MKYDKQKILFTLGAFCIIAGIITAKISANHSLLVVIGISMIAIGAILMSINIIIRLIERSRSIKRQTKP